MWRIGILLALPLALISAQLGQKCGNVKEGLDWSDTKLHGAWLESYRNPEGNFFCMEFDATLSPDKKSLNITTFRSDGKTKKQHIRESATVNLVPGQLTGYKVAFTEGSPVHIHLLKLYKNKAIVGCGYTSSYSTYGFILSRKGLSDGDRYSGVNNALSYALPLYDDFRATFPLNVEQRTCRDEELRASAASRTLFSGVLATAVLMINVY